MPKAHDAVLSVADMASHEADWCGTISRGFDDVTLHEIPPNGQGHRRTDGAGHSVQYRHSRP
jgi:gamma-glutamyltranspeptidase/glutathione hydrolase